MSKSKSGKIFPGQHDGEAVELVFRQHPIVMRKQLIIFGLLIVIALLPAAFLAGNSIAFQFAGIVSFFTVLWGVWVWAGWWYTVYIATDERIIEVRQHGFFDRRVTEFGLDKIQNINYHIKGLQAVLFRFGNITVQTYVGDLVMNYIHKPIEVQDKLVKILHKHVGNSTAADA